MCRYIEVNYKLFVNNDDGLQLVEKTTEGNPVRFYTGLGMALDAFEKNIAKCGEGENFEFTIAKADAYGETRDNLVLDIAKENFMKDGKLDSANVYENAIIPLRDEAGNRFVARVLSIGDENVRVDLNHPLAGKDITFSGKVLVNRKATEEEIEKFKDAHRSHHCCGGHCHHDGEGEHECHCHHDGEGEHECHCGHDGDGEHECHCGNDGEGEHECHCHHDA